MLNRCLIFRTAHRLGITHPERRRARLPARAHRRPQRGTDAVRKTSIMKRASSVLGCLLVLGLSATVWAAPLPDDVMESEASEPAVSLSSPLEGKAALRPEPASKASPRPPG